MKDLKKLPVHRQKEIINALIFDGMTYEEITETYEITASDLGELINEKAVVPYNETYRKAHENDEIYHKKTVFGWIRNGVLVSVACYFFIVFVQLFLEGTDSNNIAQTLAFITNPLAKVLSLGIAVSFIVFALHQFFPILSVFINEKVNTVSLKDTFLKANENTKLMFLALIILALSLLTGLVFSANAQTSKRACVIKTASNEVGVLEKGGNNRGLRIDQYRSVSLNRKVSGYSDPWCGYFVDFIFKTCGVITSVKFPPRAKDWFDNKSKVVWIQNFKYGIFDKPREGDLVGYRFKAGNVGHIGIIKEWNKNGGYFTAIEGNTSNKSTVYRDANSQDGVRLKKRNISTAYIVSNWID